jgi:hypothetical protein
MIRHHSTYFVLNHGLVFKYIHKASSCDKTKIMIEKIKVLSIIQYFVSAIKIQRYKASNSFIPDIDPLAVC